jgi:drug/metabolite transporter (DMT)-like permease
VKRLAIRGTRSAGVAMAVLTLIWGSNWLAMKYGLAYADPVVFNVHRTLVAIAALFVLLVAMRRPLAPQSWTVAAVTGLFQTTINFGATTMALAEGAVGRTAVLVFTMPFWTILFAWPVLHERLRGLQWLAVGLAFAGLTLVVQPWSWEGALAPRLWALASALGWAGGTIAIKYYQRTRQLDMLNLMAWQMALGVLPLLPLALLRTARATAWSPEYALWLFFVGVISSALGFALWVAILRWLAAGTAALATLAVPVVALVSSGIVLGERPSPLEWLGMTAIGAGLVIISVRAWQTDRQGRAAALVPPIEGS